jgi:hypothetical protein
MLKPAEVVWEGTVGSRRARVVRSKGRLYVEYAIKGDPGFWSIDPDGDAAAVMGRKGGAAKVAKGFSSMSPERRSEIATTAAKKRWAK